MKQWKKIWKTWPVNIFRVMGMILFFLLFLWGMFISWQNGPNINDEALFLEYDAVGKNVFMLALTLFVWSFVTWHLYKKQRKISMNQFAAVAAMIVAVGAVFWCTVSKTQPQADQWAVSGYAVDFNHGNYGGLEKGQYLGVYRQQLGLVTLLRIVYLIFGDGNYKVFQYMSCLLLGLLTYSGYQITKKITKDNETAELTCLCMSLSCVPMYVYATFVYGESCSTSMVIFAAWMLLECLERFSWKNLILFGLGAGIAVQMRANVWIVMIAFAIVIIVKLLQEWSKPVIATVVAFFLGIFILRAGVNLLYMNHIPSDSKPMPAAMHIAMGTNDDGKNAGWFNGYNWNTYEKNDFMPEPAAKEAKEYIQEFVKECVNDPSMAIDFYSRKLGAQWEAPMYQCLVMNSCFAVFPDHFVSSVYTGKLRRASEEIMNIYQLFVYGGVFVYLLAGRKKEQKIEHYVLLIGVFGGFLFSAMWEAKARYVFPYLMIPYAAAGISGSVSWILNHIWNRREQ